MKLQNVDWKREKRGLFQLNDGDVDEGFYYMNARGELCLGRNC